MFDFFWTKFAQKGYFQSKETRKSHLRVRPWSLLTILNFFRKEPYKHNGVLMSLLLLVKETIRKCSFHLTKNILFYSKSVLHNKWNAKCHESNTGNISIKDTKVKYSSVKQELIKAKGTEKYLWYLSFL